MYGGGLGIFFDEHETNPALRYKISGGSPAGCYSDDGNEDCLVGTAGSPDGINDWSDAKSLVSRHFLDLRWPNLSCQTWTFTGESACVGAD